jgi:ketosteroid isomerase-like protein
MSASENLEARLDRLETELELHRLAQDYCIAADHRDAQLWASVWAHDAVWETRPEAVFTGIAEITRAVETQWRTFPLMLHATANHTVDQHDDTATGRGDVTVFIQLPDGQWMLGGATYEDEYRRTPAGWRIARRRVTRPFDLAALPPSPGPLHLDDDGRFRQHPETTTESEPS